MSIVNKDTSASFAGNKSIPVGPYVLKITNVDGTDSKKNKPMFTVDMVILTQAGGSDVVDGGFSVGGKAINREYFSFSEGAVAMTLERLEKMGVSKEALNNLDDTSNKAWVDENLLDTCFVGILTNEELYRCNDGKARSEDGITYTNSQRPNKSKHVSMLLVNGAPIVVGVRYKLTDVVGPATKDGNPF